MPTLNQLTAELDRLAAFEPSPFPVVSLYLNLQPDQQGRAQIEPYLRKELNGRLRTYPTSGPERDSLQQDADKIWQYVDGLDRSVNALALFACSAADLFQPLPLNAPIPEHRLYVSDQPHLYPLAKLIDEYPRYAALLFNSHSARIFVVAANSVEQSEEIHGTKTRRHKMGGWSQARYQRHIENYHLQHAKEVVEALARIVREESISTLLVAADPAVEPVLKEHLPKDIAEHVIDVALDIQAPEHEVLKRTMTLLQEQDAADDRARVDRLFGAYRANGLGVVGVDETRQALELGQVDELVIAGVPDVIDAKEQRAGEGTPERSAEERTADELIAKARQTSAKITFIEDGSLLQAVGGVGAFLRFKL
jgi:peptide chain release factor subunit 1